MFLVLAFAGGAQSLIDGAPLARPSVQRAGTRANQTRELPRPVRFRETKERGLLVKLWINNTGPYTFAVDTGAGMNLIAQRVVAAAGLDSNGPEISFGGLSGVASSRGTNTTVRSMAIGDRFNSLRPNQQAVIINNLPRDIDGVLDPTDAYTPFGYSIDLPNGELASFDPQKQPLIVNDEPADGTVVKWLVKGNSRRPYVRLGDGRLALLDTGSGFGLAMSREVAHVNRSRDRSYTILVADKCRLRECRRPP